MNVQPEEIHSIWDNGGATQDRYTVALKKEGDVRFHDCLCLDDTPTHPLGFSQFSTCSVGDHLGWRAMWGNLSADLQTHIIGRLAA